MCLPTFSYETVSERNIYFFMLNIITSCFCREYREKYKLNREYTTDLR